jgi:hypothetical protein
VSGTYSLGSAWLIGIREEILGDRVQNLIFNNFVWIDSEMVQIQIVYIYFFFVRIQSSSDEEWENREICYLYNSYTTIA